MSYSAINNGNLQKVSLLHDADVKSKTAKINTVCFK